MAISFSAAPRKCVFGAALRFFPIIAKPPGLGKDKGPAFPQKKLVPMIAGEIRRYLRDNSAMRVSRSMRDMAYRALQAREKLMAEKGREPEVEEIAAELGVKRSEVVFAMDAISDPVSLYEPVYTDSGENVTVMDQVGDDRNTDEHWLSRIALAEALEALSDREKRILSLRFFDGRTQMEVAEEIGISQAQVSRLEKSAVERIKRHLSG